MLLMNIFLAVLNVVAVWSASSSDLSTGIGYFSNKLYQQCARSSNGNLVISPYSIVNALAVLFQGAEDLTYEQMQRSMNLYGDKEYAADYFQRSFDSLRYAIGQSTLASVNSIYIHQKYNLKQRFMNVVTQKLYAEIKPSDFSWPDRLIDTINRDVRAKTGGNIRNLIPNGAIGPDARLIVINAMYFNERWKYRFDSVKLAQFWTDNRNSVAVPFMYVTEAMKYGEWNNLDAAGIKIPYVTPGVSLLIILPNQRNGLERLQRQLANVDLTAVDRQMIEHKVIVRMPKFRFEFQIELKEVLERMGINEMFSATANFNGILETPEPLQVSKIFHKTVIDVNEKGTMASSATGAVVVNRSGFVGDVKTFFADHPFFFAIINENVGSRIILFSGHYQGR